MNTPEGAIKMRQTMIKKHGSEDAWKEWMRKNGAKGGKNGNTGGFAAGEAGRARARKYGSIGGKISRRAPTIKIVDIKPRSETIDFPVLPSATVKKRRPVLSFFSRQA